jgi:hypothetical protein
LKDLARFGYRTNMKLKVLKNPATCSTIELNVVISMFFPHYFCGEFVFEKFQKNPLRRLQPVLIWYQENVGYKPGYANS